MLWIGGLKLSSPLVLSPLAGISDLPFRLINRRFGCELAFIEMTSARALAYENNKTLEMLKTSPEDKPLGIQLLGKEPHYLLKALERLESLGPDVIDFNAACPVKKVVRNGEGSALMLEPVKLSSLLSVLVENSPAPVTVKIRSGWDRAGANAVDVALRCRDAGISALFIHGRTRAQGYSGTVDYEIIAAVRKALDIPVIGSGDVLSPSLARRMLQETGCAGVAFARGALGNPWIFPRTEALLSSCEAPEPPGPEEIIRVATEHLDLCEAHYGQERAVKVYRKFFIWYSKGLSGVKPLRRRAMVARSPEEMKHILEELKMVGNEGS